MAALCGRFLFLVSAFGGAAGAEEIFHFLPALVFQDPRADFDLMVKRVMIRDAKNTFDAARFAVSGAVDEPLDAAVDDRARAHGARFNRDVERAVGKPPALQVLASFPQRDHFRVRGGIGNGFAQIVTAADHLAVTHDNRADGNFSDGGGAIRERQRLTHKLFVAQSSPPKGVHTTEWQATAGCFPPTRRRAR